jgi:hypothetical protein
MIPGFKIRIRNDKRSLAECFFPNQGFIVSS